MTDSLLVIGLGPGFCANKDVHIVIETNRGHNLGRVIFDGEAEPNTGTPESVGGYSIERVFRPCFGDAPVFRPCFGDAPVFMRAVF